MPHSRVFSIENPANSGSIAIHTAPIKSAVVARPGRTGASGKWKTQGKGSVSARKAVEDTRPRQCLSQEGSGGHKAKAVP